jgi:cytochrome b6-f complex iron-sulfur subunit
MERLSMWPAVLGLALAMIVVVLIEPVDSSLSYASGVVVLISMLGWVLEARQVAGPPPAEEPEHEEEEEAPGPSYWPVFLALGIVGIAAGLIYDGDFVGIADFWDYGALIVALPMAAGSAAAWSAVLKREMLPSPEEAEAAAAGPPLVASGGRVLLPVAPNMLVAEAAGGAAIAIERVETKQVSRRSLIQITFWAGLGAGLLATVGSLIDFLYPRGIVGFGGVVTAGTVDQFPPGSKTQVPAGKYWLVNLTEEQGGPGYLALWWKCPHLGCTVPWREGFTFNDTQGWFRCPCHGSTYTHAGVRVYGPAPRSMDRMEVTIDPATGRIDVNTGAITKGTPDNASFAVQA